MFFHHEDDFKENHVLKAPEQKFFYFRQSLDRKKSEHH